MKRFETYRSIAVNGALALVLLSSSGCSTIRGIFGADSEKDSKKPIKSPFGDYQAGMSENPAETMIFRAKRGDGAVEVEIPRASQGVTDFVLPIPAHSGASRGLASESSSEGSRLDNSYVERKPTQSDREITRSFSQVPFEDEQKRTDIEQGLGLMAAEEPTPERQRSYLAAIDHVKQLYNGGRYEAGLIEVDAMIREYPTDPRLHQMRGTLLDRLGRTDLAMKSWNQALRFDPANESLRRFIDRKNRKPAGGPSQ